MPVDSGGDRHRLSGRDTQVVGVTARHAPDPDDPVDMGADLFAAASAIQAATAVEEVVGDHPVSDAEILDRFTDLGDQTRRLVPHDERQVGAVPKSFQ